ncbi:ATP-dependent exoDNAse (exonuclease V) beta subunit [Balneicella halophila]|uniref:DNA 3'-5' helicase n=1 Tax=Balneicella halophila TaxID=1537566 RepID=A0A7L4URU6_BALHA|nr:UvrD-helicase domain-containing protein [Balneicella halophila]PVX52480.1 ATP-dependent exoDNAse (exonuclease V) beta subunit [Balneicella halophila]
MTQLSVYKASAGSGKTFRLTIEYLKIILANPSHYKKILAITFTNKATAEMKKRILEQLHELSVGKATPYQTILAEELSLSSVAIQDRAKQAEQYILHDYSRFSVMTIDAFFQSILKAFAKELGVSYNYNVELDTDRIKRLAVERMFNELDENKTLRGWLMSYVESKIQDGKSWNITNDILTLSKELFQEEIFLIAKDNKLSQWNDKQFIANFSKKLNAHIYSYENAMKEIASSALELIASQGLTVDDFKHKKSGVVGFIKKIADGNMEPELSSRSLNAIDNSEGWYSNTLSNDKKQRIEAIYPQLNDQLKQIQDFIENKAKIYQSCVLVRNNLYMMGIFSDIAKHIHEVLQEEEKILLSESNKLLYEMIATNEVPFIYEKTGNQYLYFLWDEFQDTSQMQWHNLKPLLANALAEGNPCLIVGDIKQAIYRWRNSDWQIMDTQVAREFPELTTVSLQKNWRSATRVIEFNNMIFSELPRLLQQKLELDDSKIVSLYSDVQQQFAKEDDAREGFVNFSYFENSEDLTDEELMLKQLPEWIERLQEEGVRAEDIVFLVRKNKEAVAIADYFAKLEARKFGINYNVVSEYALLLENAFVVKVLIHALYFFQTQERYFEVFLEQSVPYLPDGETSVYNWKEYVAAGQYAISLDSLIQKIIRIFKLHLLGAEQLYLMAFEEFLANYLDSQNGNLSDFLLSWEDKKSSLSVTAGDRVQAMRVMTVHKAKGLEFHTVILPFVHKNLNEYQNGEAFWQESATEPLKGVGELLIPFTRGKLLNSTFADAFKEEMCKRYIDELNVFYVATTRAVNNLIILAPEKITAKGEESGVRITKLLYDQLQSQAKKDSWTYTQNDAMEEWSYGELVSSQGIEEIQKDKIYHHNQFFYQDFLERFSLRIKAIDDAKRDTVDAHTPTEDGKIWHQLLEGVKYIDDVPIEIRKAYYSGLITSNAIPNYKRHLTELLQRKTIHEYFTKKYEVLNERPFWMEGSAYVPDRVVYNDEEVVVIDYKFGETQQSSHRKQVERYLSFFEKKGFKNRKGFLIYGVFSEIVQV